MLEPHVFQTYGLESTKVRMFKYKEIFYCAVFLASNTFSSSKDSDFHMITSRDRPTENPGLGPELWKIFPITTAFSKQ